MSVVLLTGAAGFIGSHLAERLLTRGHRVVGVDDFDPFYPRPVKERNLTAASADPRFTLEEADLAHPGVATDLLERHRPAGIIHLAARAGVRPSVENPAAYVEANVLATANLLAACQSHPPAHFVFGSSSSVYGESATVPFREDARTDSPASPYAATKKAGEMLCHTYHHLLGMPVTCLRFFTVYGPRQRPDLAIHRFVGLIQAGKPIPVFGDGSSSRDYTYVEDIIQGVAAALDCPDGYQIYNLGSRHPVPLLEMIASIERALDRRAEIRWEPCQAGDVTTTFADISRAESRLGYAPRMPFDEGIGRFVEWWRSVNPQA